MFTGGAYGATSIPILLILTIQPAIIMLWLMIWLIYDYVHVQFLVMFWSNSLL